MALTGFLHGAGVNVRDKAAANLTECWLKHNRACALAVAGAGTVFAQDCLLTENSGSAFSACPDILHSTDGEFDRGPSIQEDLSDFAPRARMVLHDCRVAGVAWPNATRPGVLREARNRYVPDRPF